MTTVLDCIERIPQRLQEMETHYPDNAQRLYQYLQERGAAAIDKLVFIASGSSYNSAHTARLFLKNICGLDAELKYPNQFVQYEAAAELDSKNPRREAQKRALYVVISQGGSTKLVYEALQRIKEAGLLNLAITADEASPIARLADLHINMDCGQEEYLYRTIGFSTSSGACFLLGTALAVYNKIFCPGREQEILKDFQVMIRHLPDVEQAVLSWYEDHRFSLQRRDKMMIAGSGELYPVAKEGDIKLMEMVPMFTRSFELEEFIHGPQNCFDSSVSFILLSHRDEDRERVKAIAAFLKEQISFCAIVGDQAADEADLPIKAESRCFFPLEYVTVFQVLAYRMADDRGRDLHRGVNASLSRYIQKTL